MTLAKAAVPPVVAQRADDATGVAEHPSSDDHDRELVERARDGDTGAFRRLYERHATAVHRYAILPLVRDRALAEDLLADTFVRALENLHRFRWQGKGVLPWLIRIAKNLCLDHLRKSGRFGSWPTGSEHLVPDPTDWNSETAVAHREICDTLRTRIDACIASINPRYRRVLELRLVRKLSRREAAEHMEVSIGTLDVLLFRACKAFRKTYVERYGSAPGDLDTSPS